MKNSDNSKFLGSILMFTGILGIILSLSIITATWLIRDPIQRFLSNSYETVDSALLTTKDGLTLIEGALSETEQSLTTVNSSLTTLDVSLSNLSQISLDSGNIIGNNFVAIVNNAQTSLDSSASGAKLIDDTLNLLSSIPLLGLDFRPAVPLHTSLNDLSADFNLLPADLEAIASSLADISVNLGELRLSVESMNLQINDIKTQVNQAKEIITTYQETTDKMSLEIDRLQQSTTKWLTILSIVISCFMVWMLLIQISPLTQASELLHGKSHYVNVNDIRNKVDNQSNNK
jgi:methyl-accepting chemotaxis protein